MLQREKEPLCRKRLVLSMHKNLSGRGRRYNAASFYYLPDTVFEATRLSESTQPCSGRALRTVAAPGHAGAVCSFP
jgi:hypothetical protein